MVETTNLNRLLDWIRKDTVFIIISLLVLAACYYTLESVDNYQDKINDAWIMQWNESCICNQINDPFAVNITFKLGGNYNAT